MSEKSHFQTPESDEQSFKNDPSAVIANHLSRTGEPYSGSIDAAAEIVRTSYPTRDAFGVCMDVNFKISNSTTVLAGMFASRHDALPEHWKTNPEITRTVLSMSGQIESGLLQAQQTSAAHEGGIPGLSQRLQEVEHFVGDLQQK